MDPLALASFLNPQSLQAAADPTSKLSQAADAGRAPGDTELNGAARDFEAMLIYSLMKSINETSTEGGWLGNDTVGDWGLQAVSSTMAASGGFGLADRILEQLARSPAETEMPASSETSESGKPGPAI